MLNKHELAVMNQPIWSRQGHCIGYQREVLRDDVVEMVLELVHPANLGVLPPDPFMIAWKAKQIGLINDTRQAFIMKRMGQFN